MTSVTCVDCDLASHTVDTSEGKRKADPAFVRLDFRASGMVVSHPPKLYPVSGDTIEGKKEGRKECCYFEVLCVCGLALQDSWWFFPLKWETEELY